MKVYISKKQNRIVCIIIGFVILFFLFSIRSAIPESAIVDDVEDVNIPADTVIKIPVEFTGSNSGEFANTTEIIGEGLPTRLTIPKSNVTASIISVGVTSDGAMDTPKGPNEVAWFNPGPRPGEVGSAVISGHYGWKNNIPAVFDTLHLLQKGDKVYIKDESGATVIFIVREVRTYDENADATNVFTSNDGKAHLNLITCGGVWNKDTKSYSERIVVFTDKE